QGLFVAQEVGNLFFEFDMGRDRAVEQPTARTARAVPLQRIPGGLHHFRMASQAQVVVGAKHQGLAALNASDWPIQRLIGNEKWANFERFALAICFDVGNASKSGIEWGLFSSSRPRHR